MIRKGKRSGPHDECSDGWRAIWSKVFTYARNDCRAYKRQAERIAEATIEALQIAFGDIPENRLIRVSRLDVPDPRH